MEIVILLIVVGVLIVAALSLFGTGRSDVRAEDSPDETELTSTDVHPPPDPDRPVPGTTRDRDRKGVPTPPGRAGVARRHR
ncbi:MAG TPA: hypothetical protein VFU19_20140 [Iamia sp.]|nr:hypothetical protein [Iamia sp.]